MKKKLPLIVRCLLALMLLIFGLNTFFGFLKMPAPPEDGGRYLGALMEAGFIFPAIGVVFIICAGLLATGRAVGLTLVMLAPICYNILAYHIRYDLPGIGAGARTNPDGSHHHSRSTGTRLATVAP